MRWQELKQAIDLPDETKDILESLAYLIALRKERGISQLEFSERIGMSQAQLAKIETLTSIPTLKTINRYAKGLGLKTTISFTSIPIA